MKTFYCQDKRLKQYSWKSRRIGEIALRYIKSGKINSILLHVSKRLPDCRLKNIYCSKTESSKWIPEEIGSQENDWFQGFDNELLGNGSFNWNKK